MSPSLSVHESLLQPLCPLLSAFIHVPTFPHFHVKKKKKSQMSYHVICKYFILYF